MREEVHFRDVDCILKNHNLLINHGDSLVLKWQPKRFLLNQLWHLVKRVVGSDHAVDPLISLLYGMVLVLVRLRWGI